MNNQSRGKTSPYSPYRSIVLGALAGLIFTDVAVSSWPKASQKVPEQAANRRILKLAAYKKIESASDPQPGARTLSSALDPAYGKLLSLRLVPGDVSLWGAGASHRFLVLGKYVDGLERDVTSQTHFSVSDPTLAMVDKSGQVTAVADGHVVMTAEFVGDSATGKIRIEGSKEKHPFSFARDICTIFTKRGCNNNGCHGSVKGRGGFKLSQDGMDPKEDYRWITQGGIFAVLTVEPEGPKPPRIDLKEPEKSLLLLKPTFSVPHGGGLRFTRDSLDYATIMSWVRNGAPYGADDAKMTVNSFEVYPREVFLDPQGELHLLVMAHLANGREQDITNLVRYESKNEGVVEVSEDGVVKARSAGETSVIIHAAGQQPISAWVGVVSKPVRNYPEVARNNFIDEYIFARLRKLNIVPSESSGDGEFLRRVCLDLTGTLPPPNRISEFLDSKDPHKRDKLIEILLDSPEFVDYWTWRFADLFRVCFENGYPSYFKTYWEWIRDSIARNKPYDQIAYERIASEGLNGPTRHYYNASDLRRPSDIMAEQARVFLGRRLDCAQCHNHPYETWTQDQFWGMAAFFGRLDQLGELLGTYPPVVIDDPAGYSEKDGGSAKVIQPRTKQEVHPTFLDGKPLPASEQTDPRKALAEWMTSPSNLYFATAAVNRIWGYFFSRGIVDPVDDFRSTNPPTHPELLEAVAKDFNEHKHNLKHLMRLIVQSRTYQLSSRPNESNKDDRVDYSHALPRPLDAEVLLDAISEVTAVDEVFPMQSFPQSGGQAPTGTRAINLISPDLFPSRFLGIYGRPDRLMVPQRKVEPNLAQALDLLAGPAYNAKITKEGGRISRLVRTGASDRQIIQELYLAAFTRFPTPEEQAELDELIRRQPSRMQAFEDLTWGIITSREFAYNH